MYIKEILSQHRFDFTAIMACEHCDHIGKLTGGYHDDRYHNKVIPAMSCKSCGKNRAGELGHTDTTVSPCSA